MSKQPMWEKNISQESVDSNVNTLAAKKPLMCSSLTTVDPWLEPAYLLQVWPKPFKGSL